MRFRRRPPEAPAAPPERPPPAEQPEWEYVPEGWARAAPGWNAESVVELYKAKWPVFLEALRAPNPLGVNHEAPPEEIARGEDAGTHNLLMTFAYVLGLAAQGRARLSLLDWGGGIGHYYAIARELFPALDFDYHCKDVPVLIEHGRELFPDATFYDDESCLDRTYGLVFVSGSFQYSVDWRSDLARFARAADPYVFVTRLPVATEAQSFVVIQRAQKHGYGTEYLGWVLNRDELLAGAHEAGLELVREFLVHGRFDAEGAPERPTDHRGFLFRTAPTLETP